MVASPVGYLGVHMRGDALVGITFLDDDRVEAEMPSTLTGPVISQLNHYFSNPDYRFSLPLDPVGSALQKRVWRALCNIAPGQTITYGDLARTLGTAARAVGNACRANPIPIVIPCHRVVAARGFGGYMGSQERYLAIKRWLLAHEQHI